MTQSNSLDAQPALIMCDSLIFFILKEEVAAYVLNIYNQNGSRVPWTEL